MSALWLKNITVFNLAKFPQISTDDLNDALETHRFVPCSKLERESHGFTQAFGQESFVRKTGAVYWVEVLSEQKVVPGAVVKRLLVERILKIEQEEARKVGKKEKKAIKEALVDELLATALATQSSTVVMIDTEAGYVLVNSTSSKKCDLIASLLVHTIDGIELSRPDFNNSIATEMANLLVSEEESVFVTDSSLLLKGPGSPAATVRFAKHSLQTPEVVAHLTAGLRPAAMELLYNDRIGFVLTDPFAIKGLKFTDVVQDELGDTPEDAEELLDGVLTLQAGELKALIADLKAWLQKEPDEAE